MAPPWVISDNTAWYDGDCANGSESDIAGIGVVLSFVLASAMTTAALILAMILDNAYDSKGQFTLTAPIKYIRERFLDTEWKKNYAWRPFLDPLIIGFGNQQLVTGYAVLLSAWIKVAQNSFEVQGAHLILVLYICALSSSSHLAALINLRKYFRKYKLIAKIRLTIVVFFRHLHLRIHVSRHRHAANSHLTRERHKQGEQSSSAAGLPSTYALHSCRLLTALVCILYDPDRKSAASKAASDSSGSIVQLVRHLTDQKPHTPSCSPQFMLLPAYFGLRLVYSLFLNPLIAFTVQILLAILSAVLVLTQKFAQPDNQRAFCGLQHEGENVWGFGQTLSVAMLLLPVLSARHTYLKGQQDIRDG